MFNHMQLIASLGHRQIANKAPELFSVYIVLQLSPSNLLKPGVKWRMKK